MRVLRVTKSMKALLKDSNFVIVLDGALNFQLSSNFSRFNASEQGVFGLCVASKVADKMFYCITLFNPSTINSTTRGFLYKGTLQTK